MCADALLDTQNACLERIVRGGTPRFLVVKRSLDETPIVVRDADRNKITHKVLKLRCFLRWSAQCATRVVLPCTLLHDTEGLSLLEAVERVAGPLHFDRLAGIQRDGGLRLLSIVWLVDSLPANFLMAHVVVELLPNALHWVQRCEAHIDALITLRPFITYNLINPIFCMSRLLRTPNVRKQLARNMLKFAEKEVRDNIFIMVPPPPEALEKQDFLFRTCLSPVLGWIEDLSEVDVLARMARVTNLKQILREGVPLWRDMCNGLHHGVTTHYCYKMGPDGPGRCCAGTEDVVRKMRLAVSSVVAGILIAGHEDPTTVKWFTGAIRLRAVLFGLGNWGLLARGWLAAFKKEGDAAELHGLADNDLAMGEDFAADKRKRHQKAKTFFRNPQTEPLLASTLTAISPVERLHFSLYKADVARKRLAKKRAVTKGVADAAGVAATLLDRLDIAEEPSDGGPAAVEPEELSLAAAGSAALIDELAPAGERNPNSQ